MHDDRAQRGIGQAFADWARRGQPEDLTTVFEATAPGLLRVARHLTREPADAEDLLQSTFVTAMQKAREYEPHRPLLPWLSGILRHHAQEQRARSSRRPDPSRLGEPSGSPDPLTTLQQREVDEQLDRAMDRLAASDRALLLLDLRHGLAPTEIAEVLDRAPGTVRVQLHRARERMRRLLPAGLASSLALQARLRAERGLAQIRDELLDLAAARFAAPSSAFVTCWQLLLMNTTTKTGLAAAAVLALALTGGLLFAERLLVAGPPDHDAKAASRSVDDASQTVDGDASAVPVANAGEQVERTALGTTASVRIFARTIEGGRPLAGVALVIEPDDGRHPALHRRIAHTDADGRAVLLGLAAGSYRVVAERGGDEPDDGSPALAPDAAKPPFHAIDSRELPLVAIPTRNRIIGYHFRNPHVIARNEGKDSPRLLVRGRVELDQSAAEVEIFEEDDVTPAVQPLQRFEVDESAAVRAPSRVAARFSLEDRPVTVKLQLPTGIPIAGTVVDADGNAVADAQLGMLAAGDNEPRPLGIRSDASGRFHCPDVMPGSSLYAYGVRGKARGTPVEIFSDSRQLTLRLRPAAGSVQGIVRDPAGRPLADAHVRLGRPHPRAVVTRLRTGADGRFGPVWVDAHQVTALVQKPGFEPWAATLRIRARCELDVTMRPGWTLHGRLLETDGQPVANTRVLAVAANRATTRAVTDPLGHFTLECLPEGSVELQVPGDHRGRSFSEHLQGRSGDDRNQEFRRPPAGRIDLRVVDPQGAPLVDWIVSAIPLRDDSGAPPVTDRVDADGRVSLPSWPDAGYRLELQPSCRELLEITLGDGSVQRFACYQGPPFIHTGMPAIQGSSLGVDALPGRVSGRTVRVPFHLLPNARLRGRLVDAAGEPVPGWVSVDGDGFSGWLVPVDPNGRFSVEPLLPGAYRFAAMPRGGQRFALDVDELAPGQDLDLGDVATPR